MGWPCLRVLIRSFNEWVWLQSWMCLGWLKGTRNINTTTQVAQPIFHHMKMSREKMIQSLECDYISEKLKGHYLIKAHLLAMCLGVRQFVVHCGHVVFVYIYIYRYRWIYHAFMAHGQEATWEWAVPVHSVNFCWYNAVELELSPLDWLTEWNTSPNYFYN